MHSLDIEAEGEIQAAAIIQQTDKIYFELRDYRIVGNKFLMI